MFYFHLNLRLSSSSSKVDSDSDLSFGESTINHHICSFHSLLFKKDFYVALMNKLKIMSPINGEIPEGVIVVERGGVIFVLNFTGQERVVILKEEYMLYQTKEVIKSSIKLEPYQVIMLQK